jgi:hypothetical protein
MANEKKAVEKKATVKKVVKDIKSGKVVIPEVKKEDTKESIESPVLTNKDVSKKTASVGISEIPRNVPTDIPKELAQNPLKKEECFEVPGRKLPGKENIGMIVKYYPYIDKKAMVGKNGFLPAVIVECKEGVAYLNVFYKGEGVLNRIDIKHESIACVNESWWV